jgi:DNA repair exonuclease SbcCD ATPase subunit
MSENSLKIRGKFISKLASKLEDLSDDIELLSKVDRKIFKKINRNISKQLGGADVADIKDIQVATLKKKLELAKQKRDVDAAIDAASNLTDKIKEINAALTTIKTTIDEFKIDIDPDRLKAIQLNVDYLTDADFTALSAAVDAGIEWAPFNEQHPEIGDKITQPVYETIVPTVVAPGPQPGANGGVAGNA